jgi:hypothetical protein
MLSCRHIEARDHSRVKPEFRIGHWNQRYLRKYEQGKNDQQSKFCGQPFLGALKKLADRKHFALKPRPLALARLSPSTDHP